MADLGLIPALNKCSPPSTQLMWIGVFFDTIAMSIGHFGSQGGRGSQIMRGVSQQTSSVPQVHGASHGKDLPCHKVL